MPCLTPIRTELRASANCAPAVLRRSERRRSSSASDDEVGGTTRAMREQLNPA